MSDSTSTPRRMTPGDDMHLTLLMTPHGLNFVTGQDRQHLLAFGRAAFETGQKCQDMLAAAPQPPEAAPQQGVRQAYVLEDDGHETYLDGCESRFSIRRADGECVAWVAPLDKDSGEAVAREMIAALNAAHPTQQGLDAERLRNLLCKMVDQLERRWKYRDGNAPGHGHSIPGVWDSDNGELAGQKCAWCEVWQEALEVRDAAQAKQGGAA